MSWYNSPRDENRYKRSVFAISKDGGNTWTTPKTLFPNFTEFGEENGPWTILGGDAKDPTGHSRLYTQSGTMDAGLHREGIQSVMRKVGLDSALGPIFWLNETVPRGFEHLGYPTYLQLDEVTRRDAEQLLASLIRTTVKYPDVHAEEEKMIYNERSLYKVPGTRQLALLLRGGGPPNLYASTCNLPPSKFPVVKSDPTMLSCRAGVGDAFMNLVELLEIESEVGRKPAHEPRVCNWSIPVRVSIPDSHSRTCASVLPRYGNSGDDWVYLVGNQITKSRDPVTLSISRDGLDFSDHWAVRYGAPPVRFPGEAKVRGFQYPGALIHGDTFYVCYSIGKEDIGFSSFPLSSVLDN